jgi:hypothetical protein
LRRAQRNIPFITVNALSQALNQEVLSMPVATRFTVIFLILLAGAGCSSGGSADASFPLDDGGTADAGSSPEASARETGSFPGAGDAAA